MKVNTLDEGAIRDIGHAFGYYDYGAERGLIDLFPGRDAVASYICGYVRMALLGGMLHATSERGEGFIAFKRPGEKIGARAGLALLRALLGSMNGRALLRFARAMAKSGDGLDKRLDREKGALSLCRTRLRARGVSGAGLYAARHGHLSCSFSGTAWKTTSTRASSGWGSCLRAF